MKMYENYGLYINGEWEKGENGEFNVINPFDESTLGKAPIASKAQVSKAIDNSMNALKEWNDLNAWERGEKMQLIAVNLKNNIEDIAKAITLETGKPLAQAIREVNLSIDQFVWYGEQTKRIQGKVIKSRFPNTKSYVEYEPVGTVAAFSS